MVARLVRDQEAMGSNPVTSTKTNIRAHLAPFLRVSDFGHLHFGCSDNLAVLFAFLLVVPVFIWGLGEFGGIVGFYVDSSAVYPGGSNNMTVFKFFM